MEASERETATPAPAAFSEGDRVAWHHTFSTQHGKGSVIRGDAVPPDAKLGTVESVANEEGTWFSVKLDGGDSVVLTGDEIVKVSEDE